MTQQASTRAAALVAALIVLGLAVPAHAVLPLVAGLGKQLVQNLLIDGVKSQLIGSLANSGCKGAALASMVASPGRSLGGMLGGTAMPGLPGGMAMPPGQAGATMSSRMPMPVAPNLGTPATLPAARAGVGLLHAPAGTDGRGADLSQMMSMMQQQMGGRMPAMNPEQMAQLNASMAAMQQAMAHPLSRAETMAVFDELAALGVMTPQMQSEAHDCVELAPPSATDSLGMTGALMKNLVLPQLRQAREQMANLSPEQRDQFVDEIAQAMKDASPEDRKAFQEGFGVGFFPPDVVESVKARLR